MIAFRFTKLTISHNPWQCICLRETIIWARKKRIQLDDFNFVPPFPTCVVIADTTCISDPIQARSFQLYDKYSDGMISVENEIGGKRAQY